MMKNCCSMIKGFVSAIAHIDINEQLRLENEYLREENMILIQQLKSRGRRIVFCNAQRISLAKKALPLGKRIRDIVSIVRPETIFLWHRKLIAKKFDGSRNKQPGRPKTDHDIETLILEIARENPRWGYLRINGALQNLGISLATTTIANIMKRNGLPPSGNRRAAGMTWSEFINIHKEIMFATDFFTAEVWTTLGLKTFYILFFIHLGTRKISIAGITEHPNSEWVEQQARNLIAFNEDFAEARYLIHDRDAKYTAKFDSIVAGSNIKPLKLPPRSPNLNAYAERFVLSIKTECLERFIPLGEKSLRKAVSEYAEHYHAERNHQGLGNEIIIPNAEVGSPIGKIQQKKRLGGMLNYYYREAA